MKLLSVVGTRPNFMKLAPVARVLETREDVEHVVVHTGQHYDAAMSATFFGDLSLPEPRHVLAVGSGPAPSQTAMIMSRLEPVLAFERPDWVLVYGDVTSTLAAALTAAQLRQRVAHIEAGLRSRDRTMPEELNRIVTDHVADVLFAPSRDAIENLRAEGISERRIRFAGNVMIDTLMATLPRARRSDTLRRHGLEPHGYVVATLHRPSNVDDPATLRDLVGALEELSREQPVLFSVHPRTRERLTAAGFTPSARSGLRLVEPVGYTAMLALIASARLVVTDSGGLQEETTVLGIPCMTIRHNTERPVTCTLGTNRLVAPNGIAMREAAQRALRDVRGPVPLIERWDGHAADRIVDALCGVSAPVIPAEAVPAGVA